MPEQTAAAKKYKRTSRRSLIFVWILLAAFIVYIGVQVILVLRPSMRYEDALLETMTDSVTVQGFVAMESTPVTSDGGVLYYTLGSGERVSAGTEVAQLYGSESAAAARAKVEDLDTELANLQAAMRTSALTGDTDNYMRQLQNSLYDFLDSIDSGDYTTITQPAGDVAQAYNKLKIATGEEESFETLYNSLLVQKESYEAQAVPQGAVAAPTSGFFVTASGSDLVPKEYESLTEMEPAQLQAALALPGEYYGSDVVGYIISDYKWHFFAVVDSKTADRFVEGDKSLHITISQIGSSQLPVEVKSVTLDEGAGIAKIELYCEYMSPEILKMQNTTVDIVFDTLTGIRVSKDALRLGNVPMYDEEGEELLDENGNVRTEQVWGVYIVFDNRVYFRRIQTLLEDDYYVLVPKSTQRGITELALYDKVIVDSGGTELYDGRIL